MELTTHLSPVLVVDDDPEIVAGLVELFENKGIRTETAKSAKEALSVLRIKPPGYFKTALLDIAMESNTAGLDILDDVHKYDPHLPVIYLSAYGTDEITLDVVNRGAVLMLLKPVPFPALFLCLMSAVRFATIQREAHEARIADTRRKLLTSCLINHGNKNLAMAGQAYLLVNPPEVEKAKQCFDAIQDQTRRIMAMSKEPSSSDVSNLSPVVVSVLEELRKQVPPGVTERVKTIGLDEVPSLHIESDTLEAIVGEIVYNAIAHNTPSIRITVSGHAISSNLAEIRIADDGRGVPPERRDDLFVIRPDNRGNGFGLPYCYEVIRTHGGEIRYEPASPGGAFVFTLPLHRPTKGGIG